MAIDVMGQGGRERGIARRQHGRRAACGRWQQNERRECSGATGGGGVDGGSRSGGGSECEKEWARGS